METRGGARVGAGRPMGGVTQTRRLIAGAIQKGLAQAGRKKYPGVISLENEEQAAVETAAMIVDDMIQSGQGNDVMKLWAAVAIKEGNDGSENHSRNTLAEALSKLPGAGHVVDVTHTGKIPLEAPEIKESASHQEGEVPHNQPYFSMQGTLALPDPQAINQESASGQPESGQPPPPPQPPAYPFIGQQENF